MILTKSEYQMILAALRAEGRALRSMMNDLEHRNLHDGSQNVKIQTRMHEVNDLARKITENLKNLP